MILSKIFLCLLLLASSMFANELIMSYKNWLRVNPLDKENPFAKDLYNQYIIDMRRTLSNDNNPITKKIRSLNDECRDKKISEKELMLRIDILLGRTNWIQNYNLLTSIEYTYSNLFNFAYSNIYGDVYLYVHKEVYPSKNRDLFNNKLNRLINIYSSFYKPVYQKVYFDISTNQEAVSATNKYIKAGIAFE